MKSQKEKVKSFLKNYEMDPESLDLNEGCETFIRDMKQGLETGEGTLKMIPTYITMGKDIPVDEKVIVMDAGGTNFRVATLYFDSGKNPVIEDYATYPMPGTKGEISKEEFYATIANYMKPVIEKSSKIGFCFSYATETLPNKDGRLIQFSKEVRVKDLIGEAIGENLLRTIKEMGLGENKSIVLLNDTVATLLGGKASYPGRNFDSFIGFILGTGTNTCYLEENKNITKLKGYKDSSEEMIINMESGGYGKMPAGVIDSKFDNSTVNPGEYMFEKMISGRYQGGLMLEVIKKAAEDGLFSEKFTGKIESEKDLTAVEINDFLYYPYGDNKLASYAGHDSDDQEVLYYIFDNIIERAAKLVTINLASIMLKTGRGKNPCRPVCITAEGSTFYKSKLFKTKLDYYIKSFLNEEKGLYCEFVQAENATLIGAAIAGLIN